MSEEIEEETYVFKRLAVCPEQYGVYFRRGKDVLIGSLKFDSGVLLFDIFDSGTCFVLRDYQNSEKICFDSEEEKVATLRDVARLLSGVSPFQWVRLRMRRRDGSEL